VLGHVFTFCAPRRIFCVTECAGTRIYVSRTRTHFRRYRGRRVPFLTFALRDAFSAFPSWSGRVFTFCAPGCVFGDSERVETGLHVLRSRTRFRCVRGRQVPFSSVTLPNAFSAVSSASVPVFRFCAPGRIFSVTEGVGSGFQVMSSRTHFRRYRGPRVLFSSFALSDAFSALLRASGPVFNFCAHGSVFGVFRACRDQFARFALSDASSGFLRTSGPVLKFHAPGRVFGVTE